MCSRTVNEKQAWVVNRPLKNSVFAMIASVRSDFLQTFFLLVKFEWFRPVNFSLVRFIIYRESLISDVRTHLLEKGF